MCVNCPKATTSCVVGIWAPTVLLSSITRNRSFVFHTQTHPDGFAFTFLHTATNQLRFQLRFRPTRAAMGRRLTPSFVVIRQERRERLSADIHLSSSGLGVLDGDLLAGRGESVSTLTRDASDAICLCLLAVINRRRRSGSAGGCLRFITGARAVACFLC